MYRLNNPSRKDGIDRTKKEPKKKEKDKRLEDKTLKCTEWYLVVKMKVNKNTKRKGNERKDETRKLGCGGDQIRCRQRQVWRW
jgi:hypothetical protein